MALAVVEGAMLQCTCGDALTPLTLTGQPNDLIENKPTATIMDHKPGVNILPFGTCKTLSGPCAPATPAPWVPGSTSLVVVENRPALLQNCILTCTVGGVIKIQDTGQTSTLKT